MILIAPYPSQEYLVGDRRYYADNLQIVRDVTPDDALILLGTEGCMLPKRLVVAHAFPEGTRSVHCFGCGAFQECPPHEMAGFWIRQMDWFFQAHAPHCEPMPNRVVEIEAEPIVPVMPTTILEAGIPATFVDPNRTKPPGDFGPNGQTSGTYASSEPPSRMAGDFGPSEVPLGDRFAWGAAIL